MLDTIAQAIIAAPLLIMALVFGPVASLAALGVWFAGFVGLALAITPHVAAR